VSPVARLQSDLRRASSAARSRFEGLLRQKRRKLWRLLPEALTEEQRGLEVPWAGGNNRDTLSAADLSSAIMSGNRELVERFRRWAAESGTNRQDARQLIEGAERLVPGARRLLSGPVRPVVVDGSNVAWHGQPSDGKPDLDNIRQLRQKLFESGFFPVIILADASLPWQVENSDRLYRWVLRDEIGLVDSQVEADEPLLAAARMLGCPIVTNDQLRDRDPARHVSRIGYAIGPGEVSLDEVGN
jgi:hypothetical protein